MLVSSRRLALSLVALSTGMAGCGAKAGETKVDRTPYVAPPGWQTECIGRWLIDLPTPIDIGASYFTLGRFPKFVNYAPEALRQSKRSRGAVSIGPVSFSESLPLKGLEIEEVYGGPNSNDKLNVLQYTALLASEYAYRGMAGALSDQGFRRLLDGPSAGAWAAPGSFQVFMEGQDHRGRFYWRDRSQDRARMPKDGERADADKPPASQESLAREVLDRLVPRYSVRQPGQIPTGAGICTPHGFFADPAGITEQDSRVSVSFVDPRFANLVLHVDIKTRMLHTESALIPGEDIRKAIAPWDAAEALASEEKKRCRAQQGTASRDLFGCTFAGATGIKEHWDTQYLLLANGQEARVMAITYPGAINNHTIYEVIIETAGRKGSVVEPRVVVTAEGIGALADDKAFRGKQPPPLQDAFKLAVTLAKSLRPRPLGFDPSARVVDAWERFRQP